MSSVLRATQPARHVMLSAMDAWDQQQLVFNVLRTTMLLLMTVMLVLLGLLVL